MHNLIDFARDSALYYERTTNPRGPSLSASLKVLLRSRVLRRESLRAREPTRRPAWLKQANSKRLESKMAFTLASMQPVFSLPPPYLSEPPGDKGAYSPLRVRWTRYGRWNEAGTKVFNNRGGVIYEACE